MWRSGRGGQGLVEFAFVAVLMFIVFFAILELSWTFYNILYLNNACSKAARMVVRGATAAEAQAMLVAEKGGLMVTTSQVTFYDSTMNVTASPPTPKLPGSYVKVEATISYPRDTPLNNLIQFVGFSTLRAEATQRIE